MNGETFSFVILPDMMQISNPLLILAFIPIFDYVIYPILSRIDVIQHAKNLLISNFLSAKFNLLTTPLQRIVAGGMLAMLAFVVSGILELELEV